MKFNKILNRKHIRKAINLAGGEAFQQSQKLELVTILLTSFLEDKFYQSGDETALRLRHLVEVISDKEFVAKAALYARKEAGMRSVSHLVAGELAQAVKGEAWTKRFFQRVVHRPDDVTEILAYTLAVHGKPIPNALKKGLGHALASFDAYQVAKYRRPGAELSLVDAVNLVHPPHTEALARLVRGTLAPAETWETKLTQAGQSASSKEEREAGKAAVWADLVRERKIGYFALLRNLRNILEQAPEVMGEALEMLVYERFIRRSMVLPFRFRTALDAVAASDLHGREDVLAALSLAVDIALDNVPVLSGRSLIALDCSGSMMGRPMKIGSLFASVLYKSNDTDLMLFSDDARYEAFDKSDSTLTLAARMEEKAKCAGTNFHVIFEEARGPYDRVIILSDMQAWMGRYVPTKAFEAHVRKAGKRPRVYSFDLAGYGSLQFPEREVYALAGFSDKTMETLKFLDEDKGALLREIEKIAL